MFKADLKWITVRHPRNAPSRIVKPQSTPYDPGDKSLYGCCCGHGEKAERNFAAHRIDEDSY
jgi:hypothetical protein